LARANLVLLLLLLLLPGPSRWQYHPCEEMTLASLPKEAHDEACCVYAALILQDSGAEITSDKIAELVKASGNSVEAYWPPLFAGLLGKADVNKLILDSCKVGGGGGGAPAAGGASAAIGDKKGAAKEEKKEEESAEVDVGGGGLFGGEKAAY
jgi:large subunit ribosomal protein LP1